MSTALKALHDELLADKPEGAVHDAASCALCALGAATDINDGGTTPHEHPEGGGTVTTLTQEEHEAAVAQAVAEAVDAATAELRTELEGLRAQAQQTELGQAIAEATAERDATIAELQAKLDEQVILTANAERLAQETHDFFAQAIEAETAQAALESRRDERLAALRALNSFSEDYLAEHADRFAGMSDEDFAARLEEYAALVPPATAGATTPIPAVTAMTAAREGDQPTTTQGSALGLLSSLRRGSGLGDPRTL